MYTVMIRYQAWTRNGKEWCKWFEDYEYFETLEEVKEHLKHLKTISKTTEKATKLKHEFEIKKLED